MLAGSLLLSATYPPIYRVNCQVDYHLTDYYES
jgi:hypothetical protein